MVGGGGRSGTWDLMVDVGGGEGSLALAVALLCRGARVTWGGGGTRKMGAPAAEEEELVAAVAEEDDDGVG